MNNLRNTGLSTVKSINIFAILLLFALVGTMLSNWYDNTAFRMFAYCSEVVLIGYTLKATLFKAKDMLFNRYVIISGIILSANFLLSPYEPRYPLLLKYFGYVCCFGYGVSLSRMGIRPVVNKKWLYLIVAIPLLMVAILDHTDTKSAFFANSNVFVFLGLAVSLLYEFFYGDSRLIRRMAPLILLAYMLVGTSIGVIVAVFFAFFIINFRWRNLLILVVGGVILLLAVNYIDIPVFVRIKDTLAVYQSMTFYDWTHLNDLNLYNLQQSVGATGSREDNTSSIWRLIQWSTILTEYFSSIFHIPFGLGADYAISNTGLPPHNDYVLILSEYGIIVWCFVVRFFLKVYKAIKGQYILYFILPMILYFFTENLIDSFPQNVILYFVLGYLLSRKQIKKNSAVA